MANIGISMKLFSPPGRIGPPSPLLADNIDPVTKDFRDLFVGADPVDAAVQVAVTTTRGSGPCVRNVGLRLTSNKLGETFQGATEQNIRLALQDLVVRQDIQIVSITFGVPNMQGIAPGTVDEADASAQANLSYINLRAYDNRVRTLNLGRGSIASSPLPIQNGDGGGGGGDA